MKTILCIAAAVLTPFVGLRAQTSSSAGNPGAHTNGLAWQATARNGVSTTWEATEPVTNAVTGAVTNVPHRYVEIASGLNYLDPATGQYQPSQDRIELTADGGAAALHGPAKLYVKPNLNTAGAITLVTASNRVFQTRPLGVFWYNAQSGQAVLVAPVQDCVGELVPPNQVVFKSAFGPLADLRLTYTKSGIESDLVLVQAPALPAGWDPQTTRLELWHDWTGAPTPGQKPRLLYRETDAALRSLMVEPDLTDHILDFGDLWFPTGAAYATDGSAGAAPNVARQVRVPNLVREPGLVGVAKTWLDRSLRTVLVEGVRWVDVQAKVQALPPAAPSLLPALPQDRQAWLSQLPAPSAVSAGPAITQATAAYHPAGLVLDYLTVPGNWWGDYTFASGTTYLVTETTYFGGGTVTFQPGCVIKFAFGDLLLYGGIVCNGYDAAPSILTSKDDDLYGEKDYGQNGTSTHCPSYVANPAVWDYYISTNLTLVGLEIRWAQIAIQLDANCDQCGSCLSHTIWDSFFEFCQTGIYGNNCDVALQNSVKCSLITDTAFPAGSCTYFAGTLTDICPGDSDKDGIPDWWMVTYFGHPTGSKSDYSMASQDADGDHFSNLQEFQNGSDPIVPNSYQANPLGLATPVGQPITFTLSGSRPCNQPLTFTLQSQPQYGTLTGTAPTLTYMSDKVGVYTFTFTVGGDSLPAKVTIDVTAGPVLLVTGNYCSGGTGCTGGYNQIQTFSLSDGTLLNTFLPQGGADPTVNGRGLAIQGGEIYYTELRDFGNGGSDGIHVCNYGIDGSGATTDNRILTNPDQRLNPDGTSGAGIQALAFYNGYLYAMTGYPNQSPRVYEIDPSSGAVKAGPIPISGYATTNSDGFTVLEFGNSLTFLINRGDNEFPPIYDAYDGATGNLTGQFSIDLSTCGAQWSRGVALAPDGLSLYFYAGNNDSFCNGNGCAAVVQTDLNGTCKGFQPLSSPFAAIENIGVMAP